MKINNQFESIICRSIFSLSYNVISMKEYKAKKILLKTRKLFSKLGCPALRGFPRISLLHFFRFIIISVSFHFEIVAVKMNINFVIFLSQGGQTNLTDA